MMNRFLECLGQLAPGLTDGQLLARFVASCDEAAFATLVRRHGPMVFGVCRRILHDVHDAEDAFQATFLVLARKARSVVKSESVGSWLHGVASRLSLQARVVIARRRARERQVEELPHPEVMPPDLQDWRSILDRELACLPEKYRAALVLCDLEELPRREAARQLGVPEGTLSSRLATARQLLAKRLARSGFSLSGSILAVAFGEDAARAAVPTPLIDATVHAATGTSVVVSPVVSLLTSGALKTMFLKKMRLVLGLVMLVGVLGATGLAWRAGGTATAADKQGGSRPTSEVDALRKEVELLRLNLLVVLEKVRSQEEELRALRGQDRKHPGGASMMGGGIMGAGGGPPGGGIMGAGGGPPGGGIMAAGGGPPGGGIMGGGPPGAGGGPPIGSGSGPQRGGGGIVRGQSGAGAPTLPGGGDANPPADPLKEAENALKELRSARDPEARRRAEDALEKALQRMRLKKQSPGGLLPEVK